MTKGMERKFSNPPPGGLSMLDMDFASNRLSWAENIYQNWGNICLDNVLVQNQCKYVNTVGEHFRKMLDEVANDWLNPSDGCVEGPVSDLSLEHNVITEICERSKVGLDGHCRNEKFPLCVELESFVSSAKDLTPDTLANIPRDLYQNKEKQIPTLADATRSNCSDDTGESCNHVSDSVASLSCLTNVLPSPEEVSPPESHQDEVMEGKSMASNCTLPTGINCSRASEEKTPLLGSLQSEDEHQNVPNILKAHAGLPETATTENSDGFDREAMLHVQGVVDARTEPIEEFEDVKMDDFCHHPENYELALSSHWAPKNMSYKRKLKHVCSSKLPSSNWYWGNNVGIHNRPRIAASSVSSEALDPKKTSTCNTCDSDWVLL